MKIRIIATLFVVPLFLVAGCRGSNDERVDGKTQPTSDLQTVEKGRLQGTWRVVAIEGDNSVKYSKEQVAAMRLTFTFEGDSLRQTTDPKEYPGSSRSGPFVVEPSKNPKELDYNLDDGDEWSRGVYDLDSDVLKVRAGPQRPTSLTDSSKKLSLLYVLERVK